MIAASVTLLLFALLTIGMPVAFTLAFTGALGLYWMGGWQALSGVLATAPLSSVESYELISVPLFILMAEFVIMSGVADKLFAAAASWVGRVPGGLAMATALAGAGFGAISGSSTASAATLSSTTLPAMLKQGYDPALSGGVVAISGTLAMLIPPSIALILYGIIADVSIGALLIGGVIPGILVTLVIIGTVWVLVVIEPGAAPKGQAHTWGEKFGSLRVVGPMLFLFMAVTGVIYTGIATPTEASGMGAFGAFLIVLWERRFTRAAMARVLLGYLVLGCLMDQVAILILTVPIVLPLIKALGFDPVWFGVIVVLMAEVGLVTPPVGLNVFVVARYARRPLAEIFRGVWPHVFSHLLLVAVLVAFPQIILWLPAQMGG